MQNTFTVKLEVRQRPGYISAICPSIPGLHVCGETTEAVRQSAMRAIKTLLRVNQEREVVVSPTDDWSEFRVKTV